MDVKKLFTPDLVRNLMDTSRPEAEQRLKRTLALQALAQAESIAVDDAAVDDKVKEISRGLSQQGNIDPQRLRQAVAEDLLKDELLNWLEANSTISEKAPTSESATDAPAAEKGKTKTKSSKAKAKDSESADSDA